MKIAKIVVIVFAAIIVVLLGILIFVQPAKSPTVARTGVPSSTVATSSDGHLEVDTPLANDAISSPIGIEGKVTGGGWFFEASFPIQILDGDGKVIGGGATQALDDWMSTGTVRFSASINFTSPHYTTGTILFMNDNPSGLPKNQKTLSLPVKFARYATGESGETGAVRGSVILGPTCPVERIPPDPACAPKPYQTTIAISRNIETPSAFETVQSDASGTFSVSLAPGEYDFYVQNQAILPRCTEQVVTVTAGKTSKITINCDTGIR